MSERKLQQNANPNRKCCPICGKTSFSPDGTHPQCQMAKAGAVIYAAQKESGFVDQRPVPVRPAPLSGRRGRPANRPT